MHIAVQPELSSVDILVAIEAIKRLKARYFRTLDAKEWDGLRQVFADEARIGPIESGLPPSPTRISDIRSPDEFISRVTVSLANVRSVHHGHMPEIEVLSPTEARGTWAMEDLLAFPDDADVVSLRGYGHYIETYTRLGEDWKISSMQLTRLRVDVTYPD